MKKKPLEERISQLLPLFKEEDLPPRKTRKGYYFITLPRVTSFLTELYNSGYTSKSLGKIFGVPPYVISRALRLKGVKIKFSRRRDITDSKVLELFLEGNSIERIASLLDCSEYTINLRLHRHYMDIHEVRKKSFREAKKISPKMLLYLRARGMSRKRLARKFDVSISAIRDTMLADENARQYYYSYYREGNINRFLLEEMLRRKVNIRTLMLNFRCSFDFLNEYAARKGYELNLVGFSLKQEEDAKRKAEEEQRRGKRKEDYKKRIIYWREKGLTFGEISDKLRIDVKHRIHRDANLASKVTLKLDGNYNLPLFRIMYSNKVPLGKILFMARCTKEKLKQIFNSLGIDFSDADYRDSYFRRDDVDPKDVRRDFEKIRNRSALARKYKVSIHTINARLREAGVEFEEGVRRIDVKDSEIIRMRRECYSIRQIAEYFDLSEGAIYDRLEEYREQDPSLVKTNVWRPDVKPNQVRREYEATGDIGKLAEKYGVDRTTIIRRLKKAGA